MPSSQLKRAVADAGPEMVAATSAALFATGQRLVAQDDPGSLLFAALAGSVLKDDDGLDRMLVYAVTEATRRSPHAVKACMATRLAEDDALNAALLRELDLAAYRASRHKP